MRFEKRQSELAASLRRDVKSVIRQELVQQGAHDTGVLQPQGSSMIIDSAFECVEFSIKHLSVATGRLEGAVVLYIPGEPVLNVCGAGAGFMETCQGLRVSLCDIRLLAKVLEQPLNLLPFSEAEQLGLVEIRRAERSPNLSLALHQRAQCERDDATEVPRGATLHQHGP
jgi:hypothetical protein